MKLSSLFSDHAVLQRGMYVPVWGWTKPNLRLKGNIAGVEAHARANPEGFFIMRFPELPCGGPYDLNIISKDPEESAAVKDVLVGEVWLCSGQSNMEFNIDEGNLRPEHEEVDGIRCFKVPKMCGMGPVADIPSKWEKTTAETVLAFTAVGYFAAERLHMELGVPIGIINSSWGGTVIEAWTSRETLMEIPAARARVLAFENGLANDDNWGANDRFDESSVGTNAANLYPADPGVTGLGEGWADLDFDDSGWIENDLPAFFSVFTGGYEFNGSMWFRRTVEIPDRWVGRELIVALGCADKHDVTFFNGEKIGGMGCGFIEKFYNVSRRYKIPCEKVHAGKAVVACRVWSFVFAGGLWGPAEDMFICPADDDSDRISLAGTWRGKIEHDVGITKQPVFPSIPGNPNNPYTLYESMIKPLAPYAIRGVMWYQGESDADLPYGPHGPGSMLGRRGTSNGEFSDVPATSPFEYGVFQESMIGCWRHLWGQGDFPFVLVQLACFKVPEGCTKESSWTEFPESDIYDGNSTWAIVRDEQLKTLGRCANCGMASALDAGNAEDIHPKDKLTVGRRLAQWALSKVYGMNITPNGPLYAGYDIEGAAVRVRFSDVGGGLVIHDGSDELKTFVIAGEDRKFVNADAVIDGDTVLVSSPAVNNPCAVRYAWAKYPTAANLYNTEGMPASPFRTDCW